MYNEGIMQKSASPARKGFTLIEVLVVVAIISILATVVVFLLNPVELLRQARDAKRIADLSTLSSAASIYYSKALDDPSTLFMGSSSVMYVSVPDPSATSTAGTNCASLGLPSLPAGWSYHCAAPSTYLRADGTGWVPIDFNTSSTGSTLSSLPVDPMNATSSNLYYAYETDGTGGYKFSAFFESQKDAPLMASDGGNDPELYEKGTNLALASGRGLVAYWPVDEGGGTQVLDDSGSGNNGTWSGDAVGTSGYYSPGKVESWAGTIDGSTTYANVGTSSLPLGNAARTITAWFLTYSQNGGFSGGNGCGLGADAEGDIFSYGTQTTGQQFRLGVSGGKLVFKGYADNYLPSLSVSTGTWNFAAVVYYGNTTVALWLNGASFTGSLTGSTLDTVLPGSLQALIGAGSGGGQCNLDGYVDDVRVYDYALPSSEIQEMYNAQT